MSTPSSSVAESLFVSGRLEEAIAQLSNELRNQPSNAQLRSFLFELLSFAGEYDRADKQLAALATDGPNAEAGVAMYRAALVAERVREHMFDTGDLPQGDTPPVAGGTIEGSAFVDIRDGDPRVGARLEVIAGGRYLWIPFAHIASVVIEAPTRLRDLRWLTARVATNASVKDLELGEVLLPALTPAVWRNTDAELRLGRATDWEEASDGDFIPVGQKVLAIDGRMVQLVNVRQLVFATTS
ncbi:MAG: virulence protein SciE type [Gemmatimonadaceae bacterium]|nr:virulence protein SciE type [Gemmatimonadaceae bacterium]